MWKKSLLRLYLQRTEGTVCSHAFLPQVNVLPMYIAFGSFYCKVPVPVYGVLQECVIKWYFLTMQSHVAVSLG